MIRANLNSVKSNIVPVDYESFYTKAAQRYPEVVQTVVRLKQTFGLTTPYNN